MEIVLGYCSSDNAQSGNENKIEIEKQQRNKRKINQDDIADYLVTKYRKVCENCNMRMMSCNVCAYMNESNPFDSMIDFDVIGEGFCRGANLEKKNSYVPLKIMNSVKSFIRFRRERMEDIKIAKTRRKEREVDRGEPEELVARERARVEFREWKVKAREQNRVLARINRLAGPLMSLDEPYLIFDKLEIKDMEDLREDIKIYLDFNKAPPARKRYWEALLVVCDWEIAKAGKTEALDRARVPGDISFAEILDAESGLRSSIEEDVEFLLEGYSYSEIEKLQFEIESLMSSGSGNVVEFWEPKLKHLRVYKAKVFLKEESHATMFQMNLEKDDQLENEGAEETCLSRELLYGEEAWDDFEI